MKRIAVAVLLSVFVAAPSVAAENKKSIEVNYGLDMSGVFGIQAEFDISSMTNKAPVSVQPFWKKASQNFLGGTVETTGLGIAGIYDLSAVTKLDKKIHPYVGLGFISERSTYKSVPGQPNVSNSSLYFTVGVKYALTTQFAADLNFNDFGGITFGADFSF